MKKLEYSFVYNFFKENNCELLSKEYLNANTKLDYICKCGNKSSIWFSDFKRGNRCMKCSGGGRFTFEYVTEYFKKNNCELLSKEYLNVHKKLEYICKCGNKSSICFSNFKRGQRCMKCSGKGKFSFEYVNDYFKQNDCKLLATEYLNCHVKLEYICKCGNKSSIRFLDFNQGRRCMKCRKNKKYTFEYMNEYFKQIK